MGSKSAFTISFIMHGVLFVVIASGIEWTWPHTKKKPVTIEARLVVKNRRPDLLPKKAKKLVAEEQPVEKPVETKPEPVPKEEPVAKKPQEVAEKPVAVAPNQAAAKKKPQTSSSKTKDTKNDFTKALNSISQKFAKELEKDEVVEPDGVEVEDSSYFDQIYTLIKGSFVVPPHINGPQGEKLQAVLRIFLASDGSLNKIDLESSSGDEHFDNAVLYGAKRVNNFGAVPIFLQDSLRERGLVVELCPFKCQER